jgi:TPR repeat protein
VSASRICIGVAAALLLAVVATAAESEGGKQGGRQADFERGLAAYRSGAYDIAVPVLESTVATGSEDNRFFAEFYLARIYADDAGQLTDHAKAYLLFQKLADENADADPDDGQRAPFVAKALTALAGYLQRGIASIGLKPDPERAAEYLHHAATFFGDRDAQFELAKFYLGDSRSSEDAKRGMHYLSVLTEEGHAAAQAFLADLLWRGRFIAKDEKRALALITMAAEHAPANERIWIDDIYQNIFCGTSQGTRQQAQGVVAVWRKIFQQPADSEERMGLGAKDLQPERACRNGEVVDIKRMLLTLPAKEPASLVRTPTVGGKNGTP